MNGVLTAAAIVLALVVVVCTIWVLDALEELVTTAGLRTLRAYDAGVIPAAVLPAALRPYADRPGYVRCSTCGAHLNVEATR